MLIGLGLDKLNTYSYNYDKVATIIHALIFIIIITIYIIRYKEDVIKKAALYAVTNAEIAWGSKNGRIKFAEVYTYIKKKFPIICIFITETELTNIIEDALRHFKELLEEKEIVLDDVEIDKDWDNNDETNEEEIIG
jgi:hypothetical protein